MGYLMNVSRILWHWYDSPQPNWSIRLFSITEKVQSAMCVSRRVLRASGWTEKCKVQSAISGECYTLLRPTWRVQHSPENALCTLHFPNPRLTRATLSRKRTLHFALLRGGGITLLKPGSVIHSSNRTRGTLSSVKPEYLSGQTVSPKKTPLAFNWNRLLPIWSHWNL